jgi:GT2 family glycosyltransferase
VAVLHHATPALLLRSLELLQRHAAGARLLVVDSSGDAPGDRLPEGVDLIRVPNHSMAATANAGLAAATTPFAAHMNADVFVDADTFPRLLADLTLPGVGIVGPVNRTPQGAYQPLGPLYRLHYLRLAASGSSSVAVPWVAGSLQAVRREALERVGGLDSSYRFYNEDLEWCLRLRRSGFGCRLVATEVLHLGGASTPDHPAFVIEGLRGGARITRRYLPRWLHPLQRAAVLLDAERRARFSLDPARRSAYRRVAEMYRRRSFDDDPFGATLDDR